MQFIGNFTETFTSTFITDHIHGAREGNVFYRCSSFCFGGRGGGFGPPWTMSHLNLPQGGWPYPSRRWVTHPSCLHSTSPGRWPTPPPWWVMSLPSLEGLDRKDQSGRLTAPPPPQLGLVSDYQQVGNGRSGSRLTDAMLFLKSCFETKCVTGGSIQLSCLDELHCNCFDYPYNWWQMVFFLKISLRTFMIPLISPSTVVSINGSLSCYWCSPCWNISEFGLFEGYQIILTCHLFRMLEKIKCSLDCLYICKI